MRILVTGSRDWPYPAVVFRELRQAIQSSRGPVVVVDGACYKHGADEYAHIWAGGESSYRDVTSERHPADWAKHGKAAGFIRNQEMVDAGADLCIAFILNESKGATDCADRARAAGIPVRYIRLNIEECA